jgi:hypothetical protein
VIRRNTFANNAAGNRDKLVINVADAKLFDFAADLLDQVIASCGPDIIFQIHHAPSWMINAEIKKRPS